MTLVIGIEGLSGSGKTTLGRLLATRLGTELLSTDTITPGWAGLKTGLSRVAVELLGPLRVGVTATALTWDWHRSEPGPARTIAPQPMLIVEGCGVAALAAGIEPTVDILIRIEADARTRRSRLEARSDWSSYQPELERWARQEAEVAARFNGVEQAHLVVDSRDGTIQAGPALTTAVERDFRYDHMSVRISPTDPME